MIRLKSAFAIALALIGGFVDSAGYLLLQSTFTGHITGNTIALAIGLATQNWWKAFHLGFAIAMFLFGMIVTAFLNEQAERHKFRAHFTLSLGTESLLLFVLTGLGAAWSAQNALPVSTWRIDFLIACAAIALGIQNGALRRVGKLMVHTTFITGPTTMWAEDLFRLWFWKTEHIQPDPEVPRGAGPPSRFELLLTGGLLICFFIGALCGAIAEQGFAFRAFLVPAFALLFLAIVDGLRFTTRK